MPCACRSPPLLDRARKDTKRSGQVKSLCRHAWVRRGRPRIECRPGGAHSLPQKKRHFRGCTSPSLVFVSLARIGMAKEALVPRTSCGRRLKHTSQTALQPRQRPRSRYRLRQLALSLASPPRARGYLRMVWQSQDGGGSALPFFACLRSPAKSSHPHVAGRRRLGRCRRVSQVWGGPSARRMLVLTLQRGGATTVPMDAMGGSRRE